MRPRLRQSLRSVNEASLRSVNEASLRSVLRININKVLGLGPTRGPDSRILLLILKPVIPRGIEILLEHGWVLPGTPPRVHPSTAPSAVPASTAPLLMLDGLLLAVGLTNLW